MAEITQPNEEMLRLRDMLDEAHIEWQDNSDAHFCMTQQRKDGWLKFKAFCGRAAYGNIEVWTKTMVLSYESPIVCATAEEAFELIREEVGK